MRHLLAVGRLRQLLGDDAGKLRREFVLVARWGTSSKAAELRDGPLPCCGAGGDDGGSRLAHDNPPC